MSNSNAWSKDWPIWFGLVVSGLLILVLVVYLKPKPDPVLRTAKKHICAHFGGNYVREIRFMAIEQQGKQWRLSGWFYAQYGGVFSSGQRYEFEITVEQADDGEYFVRQAQWRPC